MKDNIEDAYDEIRRVDHLIHVSLKYTRTVDVLISVLKRFISCLDFVIETLLIKAKEDGKLDEKPESPIGKAKVVKRIYEERIITDMMENYILFRRLVRSEYTKRKEYRRYVTMTVDDQGTIIEIDIDKVVEYYDELRKMLTHVSQIIQ